jgi:hypothetical protein
VHYRAAPGFEVVAGRDQLPTGVNAGDAALVVKSHNRFGYYDTPTQLKAFWWGKHYQVTPFVYGPDGREPIGKREFGAGSLVEFDVSGAQRAVVGVSLLHGTAAVGNRKLLGAYARLGFGSWGILAEHDVTERTRSDDGLLSFGQDATYGQLFWALREWLVLSAIGERLRVEPPFEQHLAAVRGQLTARLASQATLSLGTRVERDLMTRRISRSILLQAAFKTVN